MRTALWRTVGGLLMWGSMMFGGGLLGNTSAQANPFRPDDTLPWTITQELGPGDVKLKVVVGTQRGYVTFVLGNFGSATGFGSYDLSWASVAEDVFPEFVFPTGPGWETPEVSCAWTVTIKQVGANLEVSAARTLSLWVDGSVTDTDYQAGAVTIVDAVATPRRMTYSTFGNWSNFPIVQLVDVRTTDSYDYFGDLSITKAGVTKSYPWATAATGDMRKYVIPSSYGTLGELTNGSANGTKAVLTALTSARVTTYFPDTDAAMGVDPHYPQWRCVHGASGSYPHAYLLDWRPGVKYVSVIKDTTGNPAWRLEAIQTRVSGVDYVDMSAAPLTTGTPDASLRALEVCPPLWAPPEISGLCGWWDTAGALWYCVGAGGNVRVLSRHKETRVTVSEYAYSPACVRLEPSNDVLVGYLTSAGKLYVRLVKYLPSAGTYYVEAASAVDTGFVAVAIGGMWITSAGVVGMTYTGDDGLLHTVYSDASGETWTA